MSVGEELQTLMRRFPTGVAVVTVELEGESLGLTVGSLVSLSLEPALVGVSINRQAAMHELLRRAGSFVASILGEGQEPIAAHFARGVPPIALWHGIEIRSDEAGAPHLAGAIGWLECRVEAEHPVGDHTFFLAEVTRVQQGSSAAPLVRADSRYRTL